MEETFQAALEASPDEFLCLVARHQSRPDKAALKTVIHQCSKKVAANLCGALAQFTALAVHAFENLENLPADHFEQIDSFKTPSPSRKRRKRFCEKRGNPSISSEVGAGALDDDPEQVTLKMGNDSLTAQAAASQKTVNNRKFVFANLRACSLVAHFGLSHSHKVFQPCDLFPTVQTLHDQLVLFEDDLELQDSIASLCEAWWRDNLPGRESLIAQALPFLLSKSLELGRKVNVHRVYAIRDAFALFDFVDASIEDLKHLLMRCVLTPSYFRSTDGRRFMSFLFGLNVQLTKELIVIVRSQIPFGRKSILEAYGDILYRAWRTATGPCLQEIQDSCIQSLIEGAIYASTKTLASSIRKVLGGFIAQRTQEGVEAMLFRLQEPILFRSLQVANSNVRRNALLLLVDMFPLEDPDASKEEKETLLEKQFILLEKLLADPCPDVRITAVEGVCRVLRLFWEVVSSATTVRLLSKIVDETVQDKSSTAVRCAVLQGIMYLLENPESHELLKVLLPRLAPLLNDCVLAVRVAAADLLLSIKGIRAIPFLKVASLESLLSSLATDKAPVARRLTRLLIPSYFPSKVPLAEACNRCITLIKRSPQAGARFCEWALAEGVSPKSLLELVKVFISLLSLSGGLNAQGQEGILFALSKLCHSMVNQKELKVILGELLTRDTLKSMLSNAATSSSRTSIVQLVSVITPKDVPELFEYCRQLVVNLAGDTLSSVTCNELQAVQSLMLAWGGFDELVKALVLIFSQEPLRSKETGELSTKGHTSKINKSQSRSSKSPWTKVMKRTLDTGKGRKHGNKVDGLISAMGAAWHVENLLEKDETRKALLAHGALSELVSGLRSTIKLIMNNISSFTVSDFLMASPIRAYASVSIHMALSKHSSTKGAVNASSAESNEPEAASELQNCALAQKDAVAEVSKELVDWTLGMQSSFKPSTPVTAVNSPPTKQRKAKRVQVQNRKSQHKEPLSDISNTPCGATAADGVSAIETFLNVVRVSNTTLESLVYFYALKLINDISVQDICLEFTSKHISWIIGWLKAWGGQQMLMWKKNAENYFKDLLACLRGSVTHSSKMLYLGLRNNTERALQFSDLANHLLDLIIFSESWFGSKGAMSILSALRPWMPDLLISVSSSATAVNIAERERTSGNSNCKFELLVGCGRRSSKPWVASFATAAFQSMESVDSSCPEAPAQLAKLDKCSSFSLKFLNRVSKLLRRGNQKVLEGILNIFVWHTALSLRNHDYSSAAGALDLVCRWLLCCRLPSKKGLKITLDTTSIAAFEEISGYLDTLFPGSSSDQSDWNNLHIAKELADTVLLSYKV